MANRVFQSVIYQMKDAIDRVVGVVDETDHTVDRVLHLVDHALKYSVGHKRIPLFLDCTGRETGLSYFHNFAALQSIFYTKEFTFATYFTKKDCNFLGEIIFQGIFKAKNHAYRWFLALKMPWKIISPEIAIFFGEICCKSKSLLCKI